MRLIRKLEFASGLATILFGVAVVIASFVTDAYAARPASSAYDFASVMLLWALLPSLVAFASYTHAVRNRAAGFYLLLVCGVLSLGLMLMLLLVIAGSWYYPPWLAALTLAPSLLAVFTTSLAVISYAVQRAGLIGRNDPYL